MERITVYSGYLENGERKEMYGISTGELVFGATSFACAYIKEMAEYNGVPVTSPNAIVLTSHQVLVNDNTKKLLSEGRGISLKMFIKPVAE